jgi:hypothetical protein
MLCQQLGKPDRKNFLFCSSANGIDKLIAYINKILAKPLLYRHCTLPRRKSALAEKPIALCRNQVSAQVKQVVDSGMRTQKALSLTHRFKLAHAPLSHYCRLV